MKTVRLTSFQDHVQAHMLQDILKDQGIESMLQGELTNQVMTALRGFDIDVLVFEKDLERASDSERSISGTLTILLLPPCEGGEYYTIFPSTI